jgi:hypothetical protein
VDPHVYGASLSEAVEVHRLIPTGSGGAIQWGYRTAAELGRWTLTPDRGTPETPAPLRRILEAEVLKVTDPLAIRQPGLALVLPRPRGALTWAVLELTLAADGRRLVAQLGPCVKVSP